MAMKGLINPVTGFDPLKQNQWFWKKNLLILFLKSCYAVHIWINTKQKKVSFRTVKNYISSRFFLCKVNF